MKQRLADHVVTYDRMGPRMAHPVVCSALRPAVECPHYRALDRGRVTSTVPITRRSYIGIIDGDGMLHLLPDDGSGQMLASRYVPLDEFMSAAEDEVFGHG